VGSFRYCVNEPDRDIAGSAMFPKLTNNKLMWKQYVNHVPNARDLGLNLRPIEVKEERLRKQYDELRTRLQGYLEGKG
jgi:hypothetical protein